MGVYYSVQMRNRPTHSSSQALEVSSELFTQCVPLHGEVLGEELWVSLELFTTLRRRQSRSMRLTSPTSQERIRNQALSRLAQWLLQVLMLRGKKKKCCPQPSRSHQRRTQREDSLLNSAQLTKSSKFSVRDQNPIRNQICFCCLNSLGMQQQIYYFGEETLMLVFWRLEKLSNALPAAPTARYTVCQPKISNEEKLGIISENQRPLLPQINHNTVY